MSRFKQLLGHNINKLRTDDVQISEDVDFSSMLLSQPILQSLEKNGFKKPSPIQLKAIPIGRFGYDLIVKSKSGTGKTAVFSIIALEMIEIQENYIQVLIIAPTREIAVQIESVIRTIGENLNGLKVKYFIGGTPLEDDVKKLKNCHIAVGAPGRLKALIKSGHLNTSHIQLFVLDEADKLLETSFQSDINFIYNKLPSRKQVIAASATYPKETQEFLSNYMKTPTIITPNNTEKPLIGIKQYVSVVKSHLNVIQQMSIKTNELIRILQTIEFNQCVIFCNYQNRAETLSNTLNDLKWPCVYFSAAQDQKTRLNAVQNLKEFKCRILSTTDLTARGIDAANLDLVVNYEIPYDTETYLHRMGRAGRYGGAGICISLIGENEVEKFQKILGKELSVEKIPSSDLTIEFWLSESNDILVGVDSTPTQEICNVNQILNSFEQSDEREKTELKNKLGSNLKADAIINMLSKKKLEKSKNKKVKPELICDEGVEFTAKNIQFENEAVLFQIAKKNVALFNITKYVCDQNDLTTDNINQMKILLESLQNDKNISIPNPREFLQKTMNLNLKKNDLPEIPQWITIREYERTEMGHEICTCHQKILTNSYSYAIGKTGKHWTETSCQNHEAETTEKIVITKDEFLLDAAENWDDPVEHCDDPVENCDNDAEHWDDDAETSEELWDEDLLVKAYDYALHSEVFCGDVAYYDSSVDENNAENLENVPENLKNVCGYGATQTYPHLMTNNKSRKRSLEYVDSSNENSVVDPQNTYESYFDYYHESLSENAPYFYDVDSFEQFFSEWQNNVLDVRNYVQQEIYAQETSNMSS